MDGVLVLSPSCLTHCDPLDCSCTSFSVHGISQARILEWIAISSSRGSSWPWDWIHVSCVFCIAGRFFTQSQRMVEQQFRRNLVPGWLWKQRCLTKLDHSSQICFTRWNSLLLLLLSCYSRVQLCDLIDSSPPGSPVPGILQTRTPGVGCHFLLQCMKVKSESEVV